MGQTVLTGVLFISAFSLFSLSQSECADWVRKLRRPERAVPQNLFINMSKATRTYSLLSVPPYPSLKSFLSFFPMSSPSSFNPFPLYSLISLCLSHFLIFLSQLTLNPLFSPCFPPMSWISDKDFPIRQTSHKEQGRLAGRQIPRETVN